MNKTAYILIALLVLGVFYLGVQVRNNDLNFGGYDDPSYYSATHANVICSGATSTAVTSAGAVGTSFIANRIASTTSANVVYLCKSSSCSRYQGVELSTTTPQFIQNDGYAGAYSCIGEGASSTISITYSP